MSIIEIVIAVVVALVAVYGSILSTVNYVSARREKKPHIKVTNAWGFLTSGNDLSEPHLIIDIANIGTKTVTVNIPLFRLKDKTQIFFRKPQAEVKFPHELVEGKSCKLWEEVKPIVQELKRQGHRGKVELFAEVNDAVGNRYRAKKPVVINVDDF